MMYGCVITERLGAILEVSPETTMTRNQICLEKRIQRTGDHFCSALKNPFIVQMDVEGAGPLNFKLLYYPYPATFFIAKNYRV